MVSVFMLSVFMLSVFVLSVVMLKAVAPFGGRNKVTIFLTFKWIIYFKQRETGG